MRRLIAILLGVAVVCLIGYLHYESCLVPGKVKKSNLAILFSKSRTCQIPGLYYHLVDERLAPKLTEEVREGVMDSNLLTRKAKSKNKQAQDVEE